MAVDVDAIVQGCLKGQHPLDNPVLNENLPPPCDVKWFQRKLDKIMGKEINGKSRLRIVWGMDMEKARVWDHYSRQWRAAYPLRMFRKPKVWLPPGMRISRAAYEWSDIGTPRWFIERFIPPDVCCIGWEVTGKDSEGIEFYDPLPVDGLYEPLFDGQLADHDANLGCCRIARSCNKPCIGYYREPDEFDLQLIRGMKQLAEREKERRPGLSTPEELEQSRKRAAQDYDKWSQELNNSISPAVADALKTHHYSLSDDPSVVQHGGFHWVRGTSKSGATPEERKKWNGTNSSKEDAN